MSKITSIYDAFISVIEATLPEYKRIENPYSSETNNFLHLREGYGLALSGGTNTERFDGCKLTILREFRLILVNQITATDHQVERRAAIEIAIMEDLFKLVEALEKDPNVSENVMSYKYISDTGIELLQAQNQKARFYGCEASFEVEYSENI